MLPVKTVKSMTGIGASRRSGRFCRNPRFLAERAILAVAASRREALVEADRTLYGGRKAMTASGRIVPPQKLSAVHQSRLARLYPLAAR